MGGTPALGPEFEYLSFEIRNNMKCYKYPVTRIFHIERRNIEAAIKVEIMIIYGNLSLNGPG